MCHVMLLPGGVCVFTGVWQGPEGLTLLTVARSRPSTITTTRYTNSLPDLLVPFYLHTLSILTPHLPLPTWGPVYIFPTTPYGFNLLEPQGVRPVNTTGDPPTPQVQLKKPRGR